MSMSERLKRAAEYGVSEHEIAEMLPEEREAYFQVMEAADRKKEEQSRLSDGMNVIFRQDDESGNDWIWCEVVRCEKCDEVFCINSTLVTPGDQELFNDLEPGDVVHVGNATVLHVIEFPLEEVAGYSEKYGGTLCHACCWETER